MNRMGSASVVEGRVALFMLGVICTVEFGFSMTAMVRNMTGGLQASAASPRGAKLGRAMNQQ